MAPTKGRFARPERRWGCRRGTPTYIELRDCVSFVFYHEAASTHGKFLPEGL